MTELAKHTAALIHATPGSRTPRTSATFARGQICQIVPIAHGQGDTENGIIVGDPAAGINTSLAVIDDIGYDKPNSYAEGSTTNRKGGVMPIVKGSGKVCYALVRAVGADIVGGDTLLTPNSAQGYRELRELAATTVAHLLETVGATGAAKPFAVCLENVTQAETASAAKLVLIEIL